MNEKTLVKIGALWEARHADGSRYLSGGEGSVKYLVLPNNNKKQSTSPDYFLYVGQKERKPEDLI